MTLPARCWRCGCVEPDGTGPWDCCYHCLDDVSEDDIAWVLKGADQPGKTLGEMTPLYTPCPVKGAIP